MEKKNNYKLKITKILSKTLMIIVFISLILYTISLFLPMIWSIITSLKSRGDFNENPLGLPVKWMFSNYVEVFTKFDVKIGAGYVDIPMMLAHSILYAVGCAFFYATAHAVTAYAVARFNFALSKIIYGTVIICMILPIVGSLPSELNMAKSLHLYDTFFGIWVMKTNFLGMYFLVFYSIFKSLPKEYFEAAQVDGASNLRIFISVVLPLIRITFFVVMLIHFVSFWNDYQTPMLYLPSYPTLAFGLYLFEFNTDNNLSTVPMKLAGCMMVMIPIMIIFLCFQDKLIGNVSMGGVKE